VTGRYQVGPEPSEIELQLPVVPDGEQVNDAQVICQRVEDQAVADQVLAHSLGRACGKAGELRERFDGLRRPIEPST
jgi:hypothetical protein